jgi:hypothetical protein
MKYLSTNCSASSYSGTLIAALHLDELLLPKTIPSSENFYYSILIPILKLDVKEFPLRLKGICFK